MPDLRRKLRQHQLVASALVRGEVEALHPEGHERGEHGLRVFGEGRVKVLDVAAEDAPCHHQVGRRACLDLGDQLRMKTKSACHCEISVSG